jgi:hypothetical protein
VTVQQGHAALDLLPPQALTSAVRAAAMTVRGQWMYPARSANLGMIQLVGSGLLDLAPERITTFALDEINGQLSPGTAQFPPRGASAAAD